MQIDERPLRDYLAETLGLPVHVGGHWVGERTLPYFLTQAFALREAELAGQPLLLAFARAEESSTPSEIASRMSRLCILTGQPVIYVSDHLLAYERKRLIRARVAFAVPGKQLFIPYLGLDLREVFPHRVRASDTEFSPAAQVLLLRALQAPTPEAWSPSALMARMGYTAMTASRSAAELAAGGLIVAEQVGRRRLMSFAMARRDVWNQAKPRLRTPVRHCLWLPSQPSNVTTPLLAGLSALARTSLLAEPAWPEFAVGQATWRAAKAAGIETLPEPEPGAVRWQVWKYDPRRLSDTAMVDPLSLILSLGKSTDERVAEALSQLEERLPW